jgi:hypothetical protein
LVSVFAAFFASTQGRQLPGLPTLDHQMSSLGLFSAKAIAKIYFQPNREPNYILLHLFKYQLVNLGYREFGLDG